MENWILQWNNFLSNHPDLIIDDVYSINIPEPPNLDLAENNSYWQQVEKLFPVAKNIINLNNGAVSSNSLIVEKAYLKYYSLMNSSPSYYTWKIMEKGRELIRSGLSKLINCSAEEVTILRNATEALNNIIFGIPLKSGDEVILSKQDYIKVVSSWEQRALRDNIILKWVEITGKESNEEIIQKFEQQINSKTKILQLTHIINWNGQILPAKEIIILAKKNGVKVLLDGSHSFALIETDVEDLDCDYFCTPLHKWLSGPTPSAMLYIKKENISLIWPLASSLQPLSDDIRKFEQLSIQLLPNILSLGFAIELHFNLGRKNIENRLRYVRKFFTDKMIHENISFNTPLNDEQCCIITNFKLKDWSPLELEAKLLNTFNIHVSAVTLVGMEGIRVTPNIYTKLEDIQKLVFAILEIIHAKN